MCPHAQSRQEDKIRCVLVHDLVLLRQGLRRLLEDEPDMKVVAEAGNAAEALRSIFEHRPEVVIVATHLFGCPTEGAERLILRESPASKVLFLTTRENHGSEEGGSCTVRQTSVEELVEMVRSAVAGRRMDASRDTDENKVEVMVSRNRELTAREREVLKLLAEGRTVRTAAGILGVSMKTVEAHKFNLMRKLGIHNKAELVMWAIQKKIVKVPVNF